MRLHLPNDRRTPLLLLLVTALALLLRMGWPTLAEFKLDEAMVVRRALAIAYEGDRPAVGAIASVGTFHPPLHLYLMALPLRLWPDPLAAVLFVGLLNGLAVLACYALGRAYLGRDVGLVAAYLFAVSPWAVVYGRKVWSQNLPLVTLAFFAALLAALVRGRPWALTAAFVALAALIGLHLGGLAFLVLLLIALLLYRKRVARRPLLVGLLLFLLALSPYLIHDALHGWPKVRGFLRYTGGTAHFSADALRYAFLLTGGEGIPALAGSRFLAYRAGLPNLWWLNGLLMGLLALALPYTLFQALRGAEPRRRTLVLLLLWFALPILLQSRPSTPVYPHYFILLYPVQFLLVAFLLVDGGGRLPDLSLPLGARRLPLKGLLLVAGLLLWGGWQIAVLGRLFVFMDRYPTTGGYGIPLKYPRQAAQEARRLASPAEIIVLSPGMTPTVDETPTVFEALLFGHPHRFADGRQALPVPDATSTVYLVGPVEPGEGDLAPLLRRLEAMGYGHVGPTIPLPDGWSYRLFYRDGPDREDVLAEMVRFPAPIPFANGVAFLGYALEGQAVAGEVLEVWLAWWVRSPPPPGTDYHFFTHLLDEAGQRWAQHDGIGFPTSSWRAGDLVLSRFTLPLPQDLPPGRYRIWAGLYTYPDIVNVPVLDEASNPAGDGAVLGEITVGEGG